MMNMLISFFETAKEAISSSSITVEEICGISVKEEIGRFKYVSNSNLKQEYEKILKKIKTEIFNLNKLKIE